jgi:hypothetical protein
MPVTLPALCSDWVSDLDMDGIEWCDVKTSRRMLWHVCLFCRLKFFCRIGSF